MDTSLLSLSIVPRKTIKVECKFRSFVGKNAKPEEARLLFDTGATTTSICRNVCNKLVTQISPKAKFRGKPQMEKFSYVNA